MLRRRLLLLLVVAAAALAERAGLAPWADQAVQEVTLPLRHEDIIRQQADDKGLDPALIAGVIFAESHFRDQTSHAGAKGLMQIMPETAAYIAQKSGGTAFVQGDLATPQVNISYGSWYLRYLLDHYEGREVLALAAYNAGEGTVDEWVGRGDGPRRDVPRRGAHPVPRDAPLRAEGARRAPRTTAATYRARAGAVSPAPRPLAGRGALVTGRQPPRRASATRSPGGCASSAPTWSIQGFVPHDAGQPWGADPEGVARLAAELDASWTEADFADPAGPAACVAAAEAALGHVDVLVANHAMSCDQDLEALDAAAIDATLAVNVRGSLLLVKEYAARHDDARPGGRVVLFTSGQHLEPMTRELPYAASKAALHGITASLAAHLAPRGILVNTINPGPDGHGLGHAGADRARAAPAPARPLGRARGRRPAGGWLAGDDAGWITGQVLTSDGGFSLGG